jgi:hypothetical protein
MTSFTSLIELTHEVSVGDKLAWVGEHTFESAGETANPNTVTNIEHRSEWVRVDGEGTGGGEYYYKAYQDGASEAFYVNPNSESADYQGAVVMARLTDSDDPVPVDRVYDDIRKKEPDRRGGN